MFKKYNSIENTYRTEFLDKIVGHGLWDQSYVVQEKAHGANLSYWTFDGETFFAGKRTAPLDKGEKFYNFEAVLDKNMEAFRNIYSTIVRDYPSLKQMTIFGELIGGNYPHKDVQKSKTASKVQKGILYSPENEFYAFDIQINNERFLDVDYNNALFEKTNILHAKTLFEGDLEDCLEYSNAFSSVIPSQLNLPEIEDNICEGVIIKPKVTCFFRNGVRVILKNKNEKWSENEKRKKTIKKTAPLSRKITLLQEAIQGYVTENRFNNVLSKIGEVSVSQFGMLMGEFNRDIVMDFKKDYAEEFHELEKKEQKLVTKSIANLSSRIIKKHFGMIRGE